MAAIADLPTCLMVMDALGDCFIQHISSARAVEILHEIALYEFLFLTLTQQYFRICHTYNFE